MEIEYEEDDEVLEGYVIRTYPKANSEVSEGETITVYISKSEEKTLKMPELIGLSKESAEKTLEEANLKLGTVYTEDSDKKEGTVIKQSIEVDTEIEEGTEVDITISVKKGSDPVDDPKPPVENPDPPKTEDPEPPVVSSKSMTIPIKLPASPDSLKVRVTVDNKEAYNSTHSASEGTVNVTITGSATVSVKVYINDALYYDLTKEF